MSVLVQIVGRLTSAPAMRCLSLGPACVARLRPEDEIEEWLVEAYLADARQTLGRLKPGTIAFASGPFFAEARVRAERRWVDFRLIADHVVSIDPTTFPPEELPPGRRSRSEPSKSDSIGCGDIRRHLGGHAPRVLMTPPEPFESVLDPEIGR